MNEQPTSPSKFRIALTGASGYIGGRLLKILIKQGYFVRCLSRYPQNLQGRFQGDNLEIVQADALNPNSLENALQGMDCAYYLVHSMGSSGSFLEKDREAAANFGREASKAGVKMLIYLGGLGDSKDDLSEHLRSRQEVGQILRDSAVGVQVVEFRASVVIGSGSLSFEMIRSLCERLPVMITPKWVNTLLQPIAVNDLLSYLSQVLQKSDLPPNPIFEVGGQDQVSYKQLMEEYSAQRGLKRFMIPVPVLTPRLSSLWLGFITPLYARVGRKLIDSALCPTLVKDPLALQYFDVKPMGYKEAITAALRYEDRKFSETRWIDSISSSREAPQQFKNINEKNRLQDIKTLTVHATQEKVFEEIERIGGDTGYYYSNWLWWLRGGMDLLAGGVGFRRGRRDPNHLVVGDVVDFWRVEAIEPGKKLLLIAEMKVPGRAWLEYTVEGYHHLTIIKQRAIFDPVGLFGVLYWYALFPVHHFVFVGMLKGIAREAMKNQEDAKKLANHEHFMKKTSMKVSPAELFQWHKRQGAFQRLMPPWMNVKVVHYTGGIEDGNEAVLLIKKGWIKIHWHLKHLDYIEGKQFKDVQVKGPFAFWEHTHLIEPLGKEGAELIESIEYQLPGGGLLDWIAGYPFYQDLEKMFQYRHEITKNDLSIHHSYQGKAMKVLIAGASGLIGKDLAAFLTTGGHQVFKLVRKTQDLQKDEIAWDPKNGIIPAEKLEGFDAVINLAGETISQRWNDDVKKRILESREQTTRLLSKTLAELTHPPEVLINGSAIGYYGNRGSEELKEGSSSGQGFLAEVCRRWEGAAEAAQKKGIRVVFLRTGIVLTPKGGALEKMLTPFSLGLGGKVGDGRQYWSWVSLDDMLGIIHFALTHKEISGPLNAVAPQPKTSEEFAKTLGKVLGRPVFFPLPAFVARLMLGEAADEMLLSSAKVKPEKLIQEHYTFLYPDLDVALKHLLGKNS